MIQNSVEIRICKGQKLHFKNSAVSARSFLLGLTFVIFVSLKTCVCNFLSAFMNFSSPHNFCNRPLFVFIVLQDSIFHAVQASYYW